MVLNIAPLPKSNTSYIVPSSGSQDVKEVTSNNENKILNVFFIIIFFNIN
jgi:hypothetical protein